MNNRQKRRKKLNYKYDELQVENECIFDCTESVTVYEGNENIKNTGWIAFENRCDCTLGIYRNHSETPEAMILPTARYTLPVKNAYHIAIRCVNGCEDYESACYYKGYLYKVEEDEEKKEKNENKEKNQKRKPAEKRRMRLWDDISWKRDNWPNSRR